MVSQSDWLPMTMPTKAAAMRNSPRGEGGDYTGARPARKRPLRR
jgi:hypothetical protein